MRGEDDNLVSFTGDERGNIWVNREHLFGPDIPEHDLEKSRRVYQLSGLSERMLQAEQAGRKIADTVKFSGVRDLVVKVTGLVPGGYEDCVDINNRCHNVTVRAPGGFVARGRRVSTVKGGSSGVTISGPILRHGRKVDHGLGNWSDQSREKTSRVLLDTATSGRPATYYQMNADRPQAGPGVQLECRFRVPSFFRKGWVLFHGFLKRVGLPLSLAVGFLLFGIGCVNTPEPAYRTPTSPTVRAVPPAEGGPTVHVIFIRKEARDVHP